MFTNSTPLMTPFEITNPIDPGPVNLGSKFTDINSFVGQDAFKYTPLHKESFQSMEQESISSMSVEQGSIKSEHEINKNGLSDSLEIGEGNIKDTLKEIINEIDTYAEKDDVLKGGSKMESMEAASDGITETRMSDFQAMEIIKTNGKVYRKFLYV